MHIDNLMESFELNPLGSPHGELDPSLYFNEAADLEEINQMYLEATTGATKKNLGQKLIALIKKVLKWLADKFRKFVEFVSRMFNRKSTTVDQILADSGVQPAWASFSYVQPDMKGSSEAQQIATNYGGVVTSKSGSDVMIQNINIPSNPQSEVQPPNNIDLIFKSLEMKINKDRSLTFTGESIYKDWNIHNNGKVPATSGGNVAPSRFLALIKDPRVLDKFSEALEFIPDPEALKSPITAAKFVNACRDFRNLHDNAMAAVVNNKSGFTCTFGQMLDASRKFNEISTKFDRLNSDLSGFDGLTAQVMNELNLLSSELGLLQMAINKTTGTLKGVYQIDAKYVESITTMEDMDKFVYACVRNAVPTKYIMWNIYMVAAKNLKEGAGDKEHPIWGQSRVVFIPKADNVVHKFALSEWGRQSIKAEATITEEFKKYGGQNLIACVTKNYPNSCACDAEKVKTANIGRANQVNANAVKRAIDAFIAKNNLNFTIADIHYGNIGIKDNNWCCIDYGWVNH